MSLPARPRDRAGEHRGLLRLELGLGLLLARRAGERRQLAAAEQLRDGVLLLAVRREHPEAERRDLLPGAILAAEEPVAHQGELVNGQPPELVRLQPELAEAERLRPRQPLPKRPCQVALGVRAFPGTSPSGSSADPRKMPDSSSASLSASASTRRRLPSFR